MTARLDSTAFQADAATFAKNGERHNRSTVTVAECFLCGRGLTEKAAANGWMVHMSTGGELIPMSEQVDDSQDSQGYFPVGSECAKRLPLTHRTKFAN